MRTITRGKKRKKSHLNWRGKKNLDPGALSHPPHSQMMRKSPAERNTTRHYDVPSVWGRRVKSLRTRPWDSMPTRWKPFKLNGTHLVGGASSSSGALPAHRQPDDGGDRLYDGGHFSWT